MCAYMHKHAPLPALSRELKSGSNPLRSLHFQTVNQLQEFLLHVREA